MRRALHVLLVLSVLWCGLHVVDVIDARAATAADRCGERTILAEDCEGHDGGVEGLTHACHHHCPIAPDQRFAQGEQADVLPRMAPIPSPARTLYSLSQAPPLDPPTT